MRTTAVPGSALAKARIRAHRAFDANWKLGWMSRSEAYRKLAERLGMPTEKCHIGMFNEDQCAMVERICQAGL